jgi:glutathione S-transferase
MDFANTSLFPSFKRLHTGATEGERAQARSELDVALARLEAEARRAAPGRYWFGETPTLLDFTLYPVFEHWSALARHGMPALPASLVWLQRWLEALSQYASVRAEASPVEFYAACYAGSPALHLPASKWPLEASE